MVRGNMWTSNGSTNAAGALQTKASFDFQPGELVTLTVDASGNQRGGGSDTLFAGFHFTGSVPVLSFTSLWGFDTSASPSGSLVGFDSGVAVDQPWSAYSISFRALTSGSFTAFVGADGGDNVGPLVDNISITAVLPEPAAWAMMALGFGGIGARARARRRCPAGLPA
jgi:hypothetical protein